MTVMGKGSLVVSIVVKYSLSAIDYNSTPLTFFSVPIK